MNADEPMRDDSRPEDPEVAARPAPVAKPYGDAVGALANLISSIATRGDVLSCGAEAARCQQAFAALGGGFKLQVATPAVFCDGSLALPDARDLPATKQFCAALDVAGVAVIESESTPKAEEWLGFGAAVVAAARGDRAALAQATGGALRFGRHPAARAGGDGRQVDIELFCTAEVRGVVAGVAALLGDDVGWRWSNAVDLLIRLQVAHSANAAATMRGLELTATAWTSAHSAVSIALHAQRTLQVLGVSQDTRRAVAHVGLSLGAFGFAGGIGTAWDDAGATAFMALHAPWMREIGGSPTNHQLRVLALLHTLLEGVNPAGRNQGPMPLLKLLYQAERHRLQFDADRRPMWGDLLAYIATEPDPSADKRWISALIRASGAIPIGTAVRLPDGRVGVVAGPGQGGELRPLCLVGNTYVQPEAAVRPVAV